MTQLTSKIQYNNFEPGEFVDVKSRTYEETIALIEQFPWASEREKIVVDLTNPSITIEGKNNDFLKLALFYNQKYVLHYFNSRKILFTKSFTHIKDCFSYIESYFQQSQFEVKDFKKQNTWMQHNLKHFVSQDFRYVVTPRSASKFLLLSSGMNFCLSIFFLTIIFVKGLIAFDALNLLVFFAMMLLAGGGLHLFIFFSYYRHVKNKVLIMSKGNDTFYFGSIANPVKYCKRDILQYTTIRNRGSRNQFSGFAVIEIEFRNGTVLRIPNLLIDDIALEQKLYAYPRVDENRIPWLERPPQTR